MQTGESKKNYVARHNNFDDADAIRREDVNKRFFYHLFKRIFDEILSITALLILSPLFIGVAVLIKFDDPKGPIFYSQIRIGKNGCPFKMYKFRSMVVNADDRLKKLLDFNEVEGAMFKMKSDPRVTRVGKIIRKYSIDEFPQLLNVIKGDMSLVGPRPPLKREVEKYTEYDKQRLLVVPGCTGLWQVGERNSVGFNEMVAIDIKYIRKASFLFDLLIMIRTIFIIIKPNNAY